MPSIINIKTAQPPYVYAGKFLPLMKPSKGVEAHYTAYEGKKDNTKMLREYLWAGIKNRDEEVVDALLQIEPHWIIGCWCLNAEGEEVYTAPEICHAQVILKATRYLRWTKGLPSLDAVAAPV